MPRGRKRDKKDCAPADPAQIKREIFSCSVKDCDYVSSNIFNLRRHQEICEQKAGNALTGQNVIRGTRSFSNATYVGDIVDNMMHGHGMIIFTCGKKYAPVFHTFEPSQLIYFLLMRFLLDMWVLFCMTRDTARVPIRGPTATSISLSLNGPTLSYILLTKNFVFFS